MHPLEITSYSLLVLANIETLMGILLTIIAMVQDKQLRQKSNIMIPCLLLPDLARVLLCDLHVIEFYHPEFAALSDASCVIVIRWGMISCLASAMWLLTTIAVHRYLLCVKLKAEIDNTKTCFLISGLSLLAPVAALATVGSIYTWLGNNDSKIVEDFTVSTPVNISQQELLRAGVLQPTEACLHRGEIMNVTDTVKWTVTGVSVIVPMLIQVYFYDKIYQHLNAERERFKSSRQVATRLHSNSRAVLNTLLATCTCHFALFIPLIIVVGYGLSHDLELVTRLLTLNATTAGTLCFLVLHGGFR